MAHPKKHIKTFSLDWLRKLFIVGLALQCSHCIKFCKAPAAEHQCAQVVCLFLLSTLAVAATAHGPVEQPLPGPTETRMALTAMGIDKGMDIKAGSVSARECSVR